MPEVNRNLLIATLIKIDKQFAQKIWALQNSGALSGDEDAQTVGRAVLYITLREAAETVKPRDPDGVALLKNAECFI